MSDIKLTQNIETARHKNLVFTSAGDNTNISYWLKGRINFDLWVSYYGDGEFPFTHQCQYFMAKKGGKFPALHYAYENFKTLIDQYDSIFVIDDDIILRGSKISHLFDLREKMDLWVLQPGFDPKGKISHPATEAHPMTVFKYTDFVEVTCPLFKKSKLDEFMQVYDPVVIGWGVDWWFLDVMGQNIERKIAVIDDTPCVNPLDASKGGQREIDKLQKTGERQRIWEEVKRNYGITREAQGANILKRVQPEFGSLTYFRQAIKHAPTKLRQLWRK